MQNISDMERSFWSNILFTGSKNMAMDKVEIKPEEKKEQPSIGADVYENARQLNVQLATKGPAVLYALSKASEPFSNSNLVTAVGGMVVGAIGFFGNRYYRNKGDDSAYSYMGQIMGAIQFTAGFSLMTVMAVELYAETGEASPLLNVLKMSGMALSLTESALVLVNSYLYGEGPSKMNSPSRPKMD